MRTLYRAYEDGFKTGLLRALAGARPVRVVLAEHNVRPDEFVQLVHKHGGWSAKVVDAVVAEIDARPA